MKLTQRKLSTLTPYWNNPRQRSANAVEAVRASIDRYGYLQPIVVDTKGVIIAGHTRYYALSEINKGEDPQVPVVIADLDEERAREYRVADNKTNELTLWDDSKLAEELRIWDRDIASTFFSDNELNSLLSDFSKAPPIKHQLSDLLNEENLGPSSPERNLDNATCPNCGYDFFVRSKE